MMRPTFVVCLKSFCVALALLVAAGAAEPAASQLMGATRDQVIARYGEPKSQIVVGNRVIMFFARDRVVLRDGVVVEVERLPSDGTSRPSPTPLPAPAVSEPAPAPSAASERTTPPGATAPTAPVTPSSTASAAKDGGTAKQTAPATSGSAASASTSTQPAAPAEPRFEIKSVRLPGEAAPRVTPKQETAPTPKNEQPVTTTDSRSAPATAPATSVPPIPASKDSAPKTTTSSVATSTLTTPVEEPKPDEPEAEPVKKDAKAKPAKKPARQRLASEPDIPDAPEIINTGRNYFIAFLVVATGVGYIVWSSRQRQLALEATAVSSTPVIGAPVATRGLAFAADLLQNLEWKRFEELVASYYSKTGVVAVRTKSGPAAPVHIKISWKGEPRPFAYVQCISNPAGLIDVGPLQELVKVLAADDIRRGYVVSTGKFNVNARDLAEEKHITLLPGDIFVEKLNALPDAARAELMQQTTTGDYTTPSCPKCEAKMVRSTDSQGMWRCPTHPDQQIPVKV